MGEFSAPAQPDLTKYFASSLRYAGHNEDCAEAADQSAVSNGGLLPESRGFAGPSSFSTNSPL